MEFVNLRKWGLSEKLLDEATKYDGLSPARVTEQHRNLYKIACEDGLMQATVSGKFVYEAANNTVFPAVGDWVMVETQSDFAVIHRILTRTSVFERKAAGTAQEEQVVAANIDTVFICMALNSDYNLRRLERYLSIAWDSGAVPVIVLTKADLCEDVGKVLAEISEIALDTDVIVCSKEEQNGYDAVDPFIKAGKTVALIGSSGVGKSTLINHLLGENSLATREIRDDGKGRHATTHRQLMLLESGGLVMDTPGMRELGVVSADLEKSFADIEELAESCKFSDCSHTSEPGCKILKALKSGALNEARFENYKKIKTESSYSGLSSRKIEEEKIKRMFGGKGEMKEAMKMIKNKNKNR